MVAEQKTDVELVEVKAEDVIGSHTEMYDAFMKIVPWAIGAVIVLLAGLYLVWG